MAITSDSMSPMSSENERMAKHNAGRTLLGEAFSFDCPAPVQVKNTFIHVELPHTSSRSVIGSVTLPQKWVTAPAIVQERTFRTMQAALEQAHNEGRCKPCAYYYYKADGCRMGNQCQFCHLCTRGEIRRRKKERTRLLRQGLLPAPGGAAASSSAEAATGQLQGPALGATFSSSGSETRHRWEDMRDRMAVGVNEVKEVVRKVTGELARSVSGHSRKSGAASPKKKAQQQQSESESGSHSSTEDSSAQSD